MKHLLLILFVALSTPYFAAAQSAFGIYAGLSVPNERVNDVFNGEFLQDADFFGRIYRNSVSIGYNVGARISVGLSDDFNFIGGIGLVRFPQSRLTVVDVRQGTPTFGDTLAIITTVQNIIPIEAMFNVYLSKKPIGIYLIGGLTYNYIANSTDIQIVSSDLPSLPAQNDPAYNRVGYAAGAGIEMNLALMTLGLETRYSVTNFIGREVNELQKNYFSLSAVVSFGK